MSAAPSPKKESMNRIAWFIAFAWTLVVLASLAWNLYHARRQTLERAHVEATANLNKDFTIRAWATNHGGVYVPITAQQQPSPWMAHIPNRDVTTASGLRLTLLNPAAMLRQIMDRYAEDYGIRGRITGLRYFNPANAPDAWEAAQLHDFEQGLRKEVWEEVDMNGQPHLRYLRAMYMTEGCEKCHGILGYKKGDLRGATGINLPLAPYFQQLSVVSLNLGLSHGGIWLLGLLGIGTTTIRVRRREAERLAAIEQQSRAEKRYRTLFEQSRDGIVMIDPKTFRFLEFNDVAHQQLGYSREEFARLRLPDIEASESPEEMAEHLTQMRERGWDHFETQHRHHNGSIRDVHVTTQALLLDRRTVFYTTFRDITERKSQEHALRLYANIFNRSGEAIMVTDRENRIIAVNPAFSTLTGYSLAEVVGHDPKLLSSGRTPKETFQALWASLHAHDFWQGELWDCSKDGRTYPKWAAISVIRDAGGQISHYMASFTDISERKAAEQRIDYLAHHDALTGLPNRYNLENRLGQTVLAAQRDEQRVAVMFIDLDRFKLINDTLGHHLGDQLLVQAAQRIRACITKGDIVARLGGDEFVVVLSRITLAVEAAPIARQLLASLGEPYLIQGHTLYCTTSIGISIFPDDGKDNEMLMKLADTAMYYAKEQGRNNVQFYTAAMNANAEQRLLLEQELRKAIQENQLELHYQPKVCCVTETLQGVEALVRWRHPERGMISPMQFIPIAEETGLIEPLGRWVLHEACRQIVAWRQQGFPGLHVAINLSAHQLRAPNCKDEIASAMQQYGVRAGELELELTESVAMADPTQGINQLQALSDLGVAIAIDDFGTGYSSLAYLKLLPIQILKLDRAFVRDLESDENDAAIAAATVALAHSLGLKVVAEGVEEKEQQLILQKLGCDYLQGYYFGKPAPAAHWSQHWRDHPEALRSS